MIAGRLPAAWLAAWIVAIAASLAIRGWNAMAGPMLHGYDDWGHLSYIAYLDVYGALPWADQGWNYHHPPLRHVSGWILAQARSAEFLIRGLGVLGSLASVATALLAALLTRWTGVRTPAAPLLAFAGVAFLPVHLYASPMVGNDMAVTFWSSAALAAFVAAQRRATRRVGSDVGVGALCGLALLAKFSGLLVLLCVPCVLALETLTRRARLVPTLRRLVAVALGAALVAGPFFARNLAELGTPFPLAPSGLRVLEDAQPPGERHALDYVRISPATIGDPDVMQPHLLGSVWGSAYVHTWTDQRLVWKAALKGDPARLTQTRTALVLLGLLPTLLATAGAILAARDARRGRRRAVYEPLLALTALVLVAFAINAWRLPIYAALKAVYLLPLSVPLGVFLARGVEALAQRRRWIARTAWAGGVLAATAATAAHTSGLWLPRLADGAALASVHYRMGEHDAARRLFAARLTRQPGNNVLLENLAAVELAAGDYARAAQLYERALRASPKDPERSNRLAVAAALAGDLGTATGALDLALAQSSEAPAHVLANRAAVRIATGDLAGALADAREAVAREPELIPAWRTLAAAESALGTQDAAGDARRAATAHGARAPRGYPYGVGPGTPVRIRVGTRPLLVWREGALALARAPFRGE